MTYPPPESDIVLLDACPLAERGEPFRQSRRVYRRRLPHEEPQPKSASRRFKRAEPEPTWLESLASAGIPVCTACGCRNPMNARDCIECQHALAWKRTRRLKLPLDTTSERLQTVPEKSGWGPLKAILVAQLFTLAVVLREAVDWHWIMLSF